MKRIKIIFALCVAALLLFALCACGNNSISSAYRAEGWEEAEGTLAEQLKKNNLTDDFLNDEDGCIIHVVTNNNDYALIIEFAQIENLRNHDSLYMMRVLQNMTSGQISGPFDPNKDYCYELAEKDPDIRGRFLYLIGTSSTSCDIFRNSHSENIWN